MCFEIGELGVNLERENVRLEAYNKELADVRW